jgi:hypothetical protein
MMQTMESYMTLIAPQQPFLYIDAGARKLFLIHENMLVKILAMQ